MKPILTVALFALSIISCTSLKEKDDITIVNQPAGFQPQEAIWLIWPSADYKKGESIENVTLSRIEAIN